MEKSYNLIVIGAGPGGYVSAIRAAQNGLSVAVVEEKQIGGTCLNRGCIPTKTIMQSAHIFREMSSAEKFGVFAEDISFDIDKIYSRKDEVVKQLRDGVSFLLKGNKIDVLEGRAEISGDKTVRVSSANGEETINADNILIATGSVPAIPPIKGLDTQGIITSDDVLDGNGKVYESLTIIGGGVIGVEIAEVFTSLGTAITIIEGMDRILPNMDKEISQNLSMLIKRRGVKVHTSAVADSVEKNDDGSLLCKFSAKGKNLEAVSEAVLVAVGRKANIEGLFAEGAQPRTDKGGIIVDEAFRTSRDGIYAIGDVISGGIQLAHVASAQGLCAIADICGKKSEMNLSAIPSCVYTDPEIASVGITEAEAKDKGISVRVGKYAMTGNGKSIIENQDRGFIKLVFREEDDVLIGAHIMCGRATDLISSLTTAVANSLTAKELSSVIRPHPTFSEGITEAVDSIFGSSIHIAPRK